MNFKVNYPFNYHWGNFADMYRQ